MTPLLRALVFLLLSSTVFAQEASLTTPVARPSEAKYVVKSETVTADAVVVEVSVQDAGNVEIRTARFVAPDPAHPSATVDSFLTALRAGRSGEVGTPKRKANFCILGWLFDNGYIATSAPTP